MEGKQAYGKGKGDKLMRTMGEGRERKGGYRRGKGGYRQRRIMMKGMGGKVGEGV